MAPTVLLVHGAWHGSWCWGPLRERLEGDVRTVDLPSVHGEPLGDLHADVAAVRAALDAIDGEVVVVAHSYGGVPASAAVAGDDRVVRLVLLCAFALDEGESLLAAVGGVDPSWWRRDEAAGTVAPADVHAIFYGDVEPRLAAEAAAQVRPQAAVAFAQPTSAPGWRDHPTTYVLCERDGAIPPPAQEAMAARAGAEVVRLESSHSPFLSRPEEVAAIVEAAREGRAG